MEIRQLDGYPHSGRWYYGNAGRKDALLIDDAPWLVKFHHSSDSKGGEGNRRASSYTNSPLGEYLGSHIYSSLGIPTQETMLGYLTADELASATVQRGYQCNFTDGQRYIQPYIETLFFAAYSIT